MSLLCVMLEAWSQPVCCICPAEPPSCPKLEEATVSDALRCAFRRVDDLVLATARREGTRDGATALVLLRLGCTLYAAHAGGLGWHQGSLL
jgi:hypothetical protein